MSQYGHDKIVGKLLDHLENNGGDEAIRELAGALRRGEVDWPTGLGASFYAEALGPQVEAFASWYQPLSDDERAQQAGKVEREAEELERAKREEEPS